mgnify:CR=1 FL=1
MSDLIFYTNPMSRGRIIRWMLEEVGVDYDVKPVAYGEEMKSAPFIDVNPMGKVPAIQHKGQTVTECAAICAYLADAFPEKGLAPAMSDRANYYRWMFFAAGPLEAAVTNGALGFIPKDDQKRMAGYGDKETTLNALAKAVSAYAFIAGPDFTAADVYVGAQIAWGMQFGTIEKRPEFEAYTAKFMQRPAYIRAGELDDALAAELA